MATNDIRALVEQRTGDLTDLLSGSGLSVEKFKATLFQLWDRDRALRDCTPESILSGVMAIADVGLTFAPSLGHAYLVKYKNTAVPIVGYRGLIHLALKCGGALDIRPGIRREGDLFHLRPLSPTEPIVHEPSDTPHSKIIGYYCVAFLPGGLARAEYMSKEQCHAHGKKFSRAYGEGPWQTNPDEMCLKTVFRRLSKWLRLTGQAEKALEVEATVMPELPDDTEYPDNPPPGEMKASETLTLVVEGQPRKVATQGNGSTPPAADPAVPDPTITDQQQIRLLAAAKKAGWTMQQIGQSLNDAFGIPDLSELRASQVAEFEAMIQS